MQKKKFNILSRIDMLPFIERRKSKNELQDLLHVSDSTFERILYANRGDKQEVTATNLIKIASFFKTSPESIINL